MHVLMRIVHVVGVVSASVTFFIAYYALVELPAKEPRYGPPDELLMEQLEPISNEVNIADTMFKKIQTTKQSEDFPNQDVTHTLPPYDVAITNKQIVHNPGYVTKTTVKTLSQKQYLFPVQMWEGGPNWNYKNYRIAMLIALYGKRSVVTIPFHIHHTQPDGWLTHGWRQFNFTYDENKLKQIITLVTPEDFKRECDGKIDFILHNPFATKRDINEFVADYKRTKASFSELWDIQLPGEETIPRDIAEVNRSFKAFEGARCAGVYRAMDFLDILQIPDKSDILTLIDTYTDRVPYIQQLAGHVMPHICDRKAFMVLQWRNKTGEMCEFDMWVPWGNLNCSQHHDELTDVAKNVAMAVNNFMKESKIKCVFLTYPPGSEEISTIMRSQIEHVVTSHDLVQMNIPGFDEIRKDNYFVSLLEQEIATKAELFVGCAKSSWTQVVTYSRNVNNKKTVFLRDLPGIPKSDYKFI